MTMKRLLGGLLVAAAFALTGCASTDTSATLQVRSAPPPPSFEFRDEPRFSYLSDRRVGVIADDSFSYDLFSSGGNYYLYNDGYWYRSPSARGHFRAVESRRVPRDIFNVDDHQYRWRSHPQGWHGQRSGGNDDSHRSDNVRDGH
jgi:hypothetical protein